MWNCERRRNHKDGYLRAAHSSRMGTPCQSPKSVMRNDAGQAEFRFILEQFGDRTAIPEQCDRTTCICGELSFRFDADIFEK